MAARVCAFDGCTEAAAWCCDHCDKPFCDDHGSKGGDRESEWGLFAYPAACFLHGGFNADE
jgi:hypothetical protein